MKFSELLKKIAGLIMPTNKHRAAVILPHSYVRDQRSVDEHLAKMGHAIERRNQHIPTRNLDQFFDRDVASTEVANNRRLGIGRCENNSDTLK